MRRWISPSLFLFAACMGTSTPPAPSAPPPNPPHWVGTWGAAPQPPFKNAPKVYQNQTLRLIVHTSVGGAQVRVKLANVFDDRPLFVGGAHVARRTTAANIDPASDRPLHFSGRTAVEIPAHASVLSDPVGIDVPALSDLAVSLFLPRETRATTTHVMALQTSYVSTGDATGAATFPVASTTKSWPFLTGVEVAGRPNASAVVVFGDSTIDGDGSTEDANRRWPDALAARLHAAGVEAGVVNEGMIGNRLLHDSPRGELNPAGPAFGPSGLARFERDTLEQSGVSAVILGIGINDVGFPDAFAPASEAVTSNAMLGGYRELVARARQRQLRVLGSTLLPFEGAKLADNFYTPEKDALRQRLNAWVRDGGAFDAVLDFDRALRDPAHPSRLLPAFDSGDHLHPSDAGYAAMAELVPSSLFPGATSLMDAQRRAVEVLTSSVRTHDAKLLGSIYTEDALFASPGRKGWDESRGRQTIVEQHERLFASFPDLAWAATRALARGNVLVVEWVTNGTNTGARGNRPPTNARMGFRAASVFWFDERGLVTREHAYIDFATMAAQLGGTPGARAVPPVPIAGAEWIVAAPGTLDRAATPSWPSLFSRGDAAYAEAIGDDMIHEDVAAGSTVVGRDANVAERRAQADALPSIEVTVDELWTFDDYAVVEFTLRGANQRFTLHGLEVDHLRGRRLARATTYMNGAELAAQLGRPSLR
jgi:lysophospholipase L1-like esterase